MADQEPIKEIMAGSRLLQQAQARQEVLWINPEVRSEPDFAVEGLSIAAIDDAEERLQRFAPYIQAAFPETAVTEGLIESPLVEVPAMKQWLIEHIGELKGRLFLKEDNIYKAPAKEKGIGSRVELNPILP